MSYSLTVNYHLFSVIATFFNFAKASIGSGSFALPFAVLSAGVLLGSAGMIILGIVRLVMNGWGLPVDNRIDGWTK